MNKKRAIRELMTDPLHAINDIKLFYQNDLNYSTKLCEKTLLIFIIIYKTIIHQRLI